MAILHTKHGMEMTINHRPNIIRHRKRTKNRRQTKSVRKAILIWPSNLLPGWMTKVSKGRNYSNLSERQQSYKSIHLLPCPFSPLQTTKIKEVLSPLRLEGLQTQRSLLGQNQIKPRTFASIQMLHMLFTDIIEDKSIIKKLQMGHLQSLTTSSTN